MNIPDHVKYILETLNNAGYEAYIVGGCVRDKIMGKSPKDWDITTSALPEEVIPLFQRVVETGIKHGTVTVVLNKDNYEITTYRIDGAYKDHRRPEEVFFTASLAEDLRRRDFTMNAIAYHPLAGYVDPFGGRLDISNRVIRGVGDPVQRFNEDALRMLRAVRFACTTGFHVEKGTYRALKENACLIKDVSAERVREELVKAFLGGYPENLFMLTDSGLMQYFYKGFHHYLETEGAALVPLVKQCQKEVVLVFSLLFKDMDEKSIEELLLALKFDHKTVKRICASSPMINKPLDGSRYGVKKLLNEKGREVLGDIFYLKRLCGQEAASMEETLEAIIAANEPVSVKDLQINGTILMEAYPVKGREVGWLLSSLHDKVLQNPGLNESEKLIALAGELLKGL